jgi:hypothetical protein
MVDYIQVITKQFSVFFPNRIVPPYLLKRSSYLLWWIPGVVTFEPGHAHRKYQCHFWRSEWNTKIWYIVGALLGG